MIFRSDGMYLPESSAPLGYQEFNREDGRQVKSVHAAVRFWMGLSPSERAVLDERTIWPRALVDRGEAKSTHGFLIPLTPPEFFCNLADPDSGKIISRPREMKWLISSAKQRRAAQIDLTEVDKTERLMLLAQLIYTIGFLHKHGWVYGDLHFGNVLFALNPPRIILLDCDGAAALSDPTRRQGSAPFWDPPECQIVSRASKEQPQRLQDDATDVYKLGLMILRSLTPGQGAATTRAPGRIADELDKEGAALVAGALSLDRLARPTAYELYSYLSRTISRRIGIPEALAIGHIMPDLARTSGGHVFISYVSDDSKVVDRLQNDLESAGVAVWRDRTSLGPGDRWKDSIRRAIAAGSFFICCFSEASKRRTRSYMNEELALAIEELRVRSREEVWFLPVIFPGGEIPDRPIGAGENLRDFNHVLLAPTHWTEGINDLVRVVQRH
jgi:TIR domain